MLKINTSILKNFNMNWTLFVIAGVAMIGFTGLAQEKTNIKTANYETRFGRDEWNSKDWTFVKSPRWNHIGEWVQEADHIRNRIPEGVGENELITERHSCAYMSMVRAIPYDTGKGLTITARMSFSYDQGPQIVLADQMGVDENGYPEYRDHYEVVLYSKGINVWRHTYREAQPGWALVGYARFPLEAGTAYDLAVRIEPVRRSENGPAQTGRTVMVTVDGQHTFAFHAPEMPDPVYAGVIGYASLNRFYHFSITQKDRP